MNILENKTNILPAVPSGNLLANTVGCKYVVQQPAETLSSSYNTH